MTPLTNQKLVEAASQALGEIGEVGSLSLGAANKLERAIKEASAPMKEFAGLSKERWLDLAMLCEMSLLEPDEANACRQIADGLSE